MRNKFDSECSDKNKNGAEKVFEESATGDGPVDAVFNSIERALR